MTHGPLPVHGFVLAGGRSTRMGRDKALLPFEGEPLVARAVAKLRTFCERVSIVGEREDLAQFAPVVRGERAGMGPGAGIEAGLHACTDGWAMFVPVDVPLVPAELLRAWAMEVTEGARHGMGVSALLGCGVRQPAFCLIRADCAAKVTVALDGRVRRLEELLLAVDTKEGDSWMEWRRLLDHGSAAQEEMWFQNVNMPQDLALATGWAAELAGAQTSAVPYLKHGG